MGLHGAHTRGDVSGVRAPVGASATVILMEEMIALGVRNFVRIGLCGSLDVRHPFGSLVIAGESRRDEGASYHDAPPEVGVEPSRRALDAVKGVGRGDIPVVARWSTDGIYRETKGKIGRRRDADVRTVDMEASAVYTLARYRGVEAVMILVVSDELWHPEWRPGFFEEAVLAGKEEALRIGLKVAGRMAGGL